MNRLNNTILAGLSAVVIGIVNIASMGAVNAVFSSTHKPLQSEFTLGGDEGIASSDGNSGSFLKTTTGETNGATSETTAQSDSSGNAGGTSSTPAASGTTSSGQTSSAGSGATTGGSTGSSGGGSSSGSSGGGGGSTPATPSQPSTPASLAKGSPCQTQTPPSGVCSAVLSFNNQKTGNPNWDPPLLVSIKQGIADNGFVKALHLNVDDIYNSMQITLQENTWSGSATKGTIAGKMGAAGQSEATTFTLDWNGSKWIVTGVTQG